ncbi:hypothetical protein H9L39_18168 [Fusarium oxysporum f. sp. albedinis]|nr:hypothetical protein H9L39_18168 [Fusarium oxysporum f. sp. albedinis]
MFKPKLPPPNGDHPVGFAAIAPNRKSTNQKPMSRRIPGTLKITSAKHTVSSIQIHQKQSATYWRDL